MVQWVVKLTVSTLNIRYVMEATGVYYESLACYLADHEPSVSIILPNKISNCFRTLSAKTVTEKSASESPFFVLKVLQESYLTGVVNPQMRKLVRALYRTFFQKIFHPKLE